MTQIPPEMLVWDIFSAATACCMSGAILLFSCSDVKEMMGLVLIVFSLGMIFLEPISIVKSAHGLAAVVETSLASTASTFLCGFIIFVMAYIEYLGVRDQVLFAISLGMIHTLVWVFFYRLASYFASIALCGSMFLVVAFFSRSDYNLIKDIVTTSSSAKLVIGVVVASLLINLPTIRLGRAVAAAAFELEELNRRIKHLDRRVEGEMIDNPEGYRLAKENIGAARSLGGIASRSLARLKDLTAELDLHGWGDRLGWKRADLTDRGSALLEETQLRLTEANGRAAGALLQIVGSREPSTAEEPARPSDPPKEDRAREHRADVDALVRPDFECAICLGVPPAHAGVSCLRIGHLSSLQGRIPGNLSLQCLCIGRPQR